ncbi:MAG: Maf-like protein [Capnocytophaga sp.]|nr:Maf-like protein [Capnocytophaga sp.]
MLNKPLEKYRIILASGSPRRQQFLKELGLNFVVMLKEVDETYPDELKEGAITEYLARKKALPFGEILQPGDILITSDTIVWHEGKALGKPRNADEAYHILQSLSGKQHKVITSACVTTAQQQITLTDTSSVTFGKLSDEAIHYYIKTYKPYDKAGAYGIQEWIGHIGITHIDGSYNTVMGLPTHLLYRALEEIGK